MPIMPPHYGSTSNTNSGSVTSVNGKTGVISLTAKDLDAQPKNKTLDNIATANFSPESLLWVNKDLTFSTMTPTNYSLSLMRLGSDEAYRSMLQLGNMASLDLDENGKIPKTLLEGNISNVALTGRYSDLTDKPTLFDGDYNSLKNKPSPPEISHPVSSVNNKTGKVSLTFNDVGASPASHTHQMSEVAGLETTLNSKITVGSTIPYSTLTGVPALFSGDYNDLSNKPVLFNGDYNLLTNKPITPNQVQSDWNQVDPTAKDFIKNKPTINQNLTGVTSVNGKTGAAVLTNTDVGASPILHTHNITDVMGLQEALSDKLSSSANIPYSKITGAPERFSGNYNDLTNRPALFNGTWAALTGKPTLSTVATSGSYIDLLNKPSIPTNTSQIAEGTNLYYTDARVGSYLSTQGVKRSEVIAGTTNASGVFPVTFSKTYSSPPHVNPVLINGTANQTVLISNVTTTGCTVSVVQRNAVTLLALEVLLAATTPVSGATISVLVIEK